MMLRNSKIYNLRKFGKYFESMCIYYVTVYLS
jgi:hypothetical protein